MGAADLATYAEIGLVIFMAVFAAISVRVFWPGQGEQMKRFGQIPLSDDPITAGDASAASKETSR